MAGLPLYIDEAVRRVSNPAYSDGTSTWIGANQATFKLIVCLEAIRDLTGALQLLDQVPRLDTATRTIKQLTVPLYSFTDGLRRVHGELEGNAPAYRLKKQSRKSLAAQRRAFECSLSSHGNVKFVRDKIGAHLDLDAVNNPSETWNAIDIESFLRAMELCLSEFERLLALDVYAWWLDDGDASSLKLMSVDGSLVHLSRGEEPEPLAITVVRSPKLGIFAESRQLLEIVSRILAKLASTGGTDKPL